MWGLKAHKMVLYIYKSIAQPNHGYLFPKWDALDVLSKMRTEDVLPNEYTFAACVEKSGFKDLAMLGML